VAPIRNPSFSPGRGAKGLLDGLLALLWDFCACMLDLAFDPDESE
jgi:hypothetical protein